MPLEDNPSAAAATAPTCLDSVPGQRVWTTACLAPGLCARSIRGGRGQRLGWNRGPRRPLRRHCGRAAWRMVCLAHGRCAGRASGALLRRFHPDRKSVQSARFPQARNLNESGNLTALLTKAYKRFVLLDEFFSQFVKGYIFDEKVFAWLRCCLPSIQTRNFLSTNRLCSICCRAAAGPFHPAVGLRRTRIPGPLLRAIRSQAVEVTQVWRLS